MTPHRVSIVLVAIALVAGCRSTTAPQSPEVGEPMLLGGPGAVSAARERLRTGAYPLALGNRWDYLATSRWILHPASSPDSSIVLADERLTFADEIVCTESRGGTDYFVNRREYAPGGDVSRWRERQDRDGLYELDDSGEPSACEPTRSVTPSPGSGASATSRVRIESRLTASRDAAAWRAAAEQIERRRTALATLGRDLAGAAVQPGELQRLRYPLRVGQRWVIRDVPRFEARVEGVRDLDGRFPHRRAWVVRITSELFGADDVVHTYYTGQGYSGLDAALFAEATDSEGNPVGVLESRQRERLTGFRPGARLGAGALPLAAAD